MPEISKFRIRWLRFIGWLLFCATLGWVTGLWALYLPLMAFAFVFGVRYSEDSPTTEDAGDEATASDDNDQKYATWGLRGTISEEDRARLEREAQKRRR